ncbi:hypothetical protein ACHAW6_007244 [Cyclotella cf. meneghiniana]
MMQHRIQHNPTYTSLKNHAAAFTALFMTVFLLCIEHVRAFANQYHLSAHDAMVLASAASSLSRKLSASCMGSLKVEKMKKSISFMSNASSYAARSAEGSSTKLSMAWSIPAISLPTFPTFTSKDLPVHTLGSWYSEVDPTNKLPVYDDDYENSYSFSSPTDDWPSTFDASSEVSNSRQQPAGRRRPLRAIRRVAVRFVEGIRFPHSSY